MRWIVQPGCHASDIRNPRSFLLTSFNEQAIKALHSQVCECLNSSQPFLPIHIESPGGSVYALSGILSIMDYGRANGLIFPTVVSGFAASAGAMVFCYGDHGYRYIGSFGSLMLHNCQVGGMGKVHEIHASYSKAIEDETFLFEKISKNLKKPKDWLKKSLEKKKNYDWFLTAQESLDLGLASEIKTPTFVLKVEEKFIIV